MGAIGLTFGQIALATTTYSGIRSFNDHALAKNVVQHAVPNSTVFPTKDIGYAPTSITFTIRLADSAVDAFMTDLATGTSERKLSYVQGTTEVYGYCYSGSVDSHVVMNPWGTTGTKYHDLACTIPLSRSKLYKASDDSVLRGS